MTDGPLAALRTTSRVSSISTTPFRDQTTAHANITGSKQPPPIKTAAIPQGIMSDRKIKPAPPNPNKSISTGTTTHDNGNSTTHRRNDSAVIGAIGNLCISGIAFGARCLPPSQEF
jgi:hypothetical protein